METCGVAGVSGAQWLSFSAAWHVPSEYDEDSHVIEPSTAHATTLFRFKRATGLCNENHSIVELRDCLKLAKSVLSARKTFHRPSRR